MSNSFDYYNSVVYTRQNKINTNRSLMYLYKTQDIVHSVEAAQHTEKDREKGLKLKGEKRRRF